MSFKKWKNNKILLNWTEGWWCQFYSFYEHDWSRSIFMTANSGLVHILNLVNSLVQHVKIVSTNEKMHFLYLKTYFSYFTKTFLSHTTNMLTFVVLKLLLFLDTLSPFWSQTQLTLTIWLIFFLFSSFDNKQILN